MSSADVELLFVSDARNRNVTISVVPGTFNGTSPSSPQIKDFRE